MADCVALVVAAGRGQRFGGTLPKQYQNLGGKPLLRRALDAFADHPRVDAIRAVIHRDDRDLYDAAVSGLDLLDPVPGGASRQDSARAGLESLEEIAPRLVLIHDAARPFVEPGLVSRVVDALDTTPAAIPAVAVHDTLKRGDGAVAPRITATVDRRDLWRAQTPQGFRYPDILAAHRRFAGNDLTDDAAVAEHAGLGVALVDGDEDNVKVTTPEDFRRANRFFAGTMITRVGTGFDVHRFGPGDHIMLGGVAIPHDASLEGHSDADVALHALTDAILGAVAAGDIGSHFPPSDPQWRGAPSATFLAHAADMVAEARGRIVGVDVTIICERPRIGPHRTAMTECIATLLGVPADRVSIKGTTTERLGFTGRGEGIAAQAIATVQMPLD